MSTTRQAATIMRRRKEPLILRLLYLAVFGKEDLMHTLFPRRTRRTQLSIVTRSKT